MTATLPARTPQPGPLPRGAGLPTGPPPTLFQERTRLVDGTLGLVVLFAWSPPGVPAFLALGLVAVLTLVAVALTRPPAWRVDGPLGLGWLAPGAVVVLSYLGAVTLASPDLSLFGWERRALRLAMVVCFLLVLVSGRVHLPSLLRGVIAGLLLNAVLFFVGLAPADYGSFLSGFLLDKNQAGLAYAAVGVLALGVFRERHRWAVVLAGGGLVWLTGSRTSLAAFGCGVAWFLLRPRLTVVGRLALALALATAVRVLELDFARVGVFADREGTDWFRARIDAASSTKLDTAPWFGAGLGEAWVPLDGSTYLFHNSYWAALMEGGWPLAVVYAGLTAVVGVGLLRPGPPVARWATAAEAANVTVLVCALRLGEVFGATTGVLVLAAGAVAGLAARRVAGTPARESAPVAADP